MIQGVQRIPYSDAQSLRLMIFGFVFVLIIAAIGFATTETLAQPTPQLQPSAQQSSNASITLTYSEAAPSSEIEVSGGIIGHIEAIFAGKQEAPLHALFRVNVSGKLHKSETEPWKVTLVLGQAQEHIGDQLKQKVNLAVEAQFMMSLLKPWSIDLTKEQVESCKKDGKVSIQIEGPMDVLQTWDVPESITLTIVDPDSIEKIERISFVRKAADIFTPIYVVLYNEEFFIEVRFAKPPKKAFKTVDLEIDGKKSHLIIIERTETNPSVFRSEPMFLVQPEQQPTNN